MGKLIQILGMTFLLPLAAGAQALAPAPPPSPAPPPPAEEAATESKPEVTAPPAEAVAERPVKNTAPTNDLPSRYAGPDVGPYVQSLSMVFSIASRSTDPFGQSQDLTAKPIKAKVAHTTAPKPAAIPPTPYADIVAQLQVTGVIPGEGRFLVGTRSFALGDRFPLSYRGRDYPTQVAEVSKEQIVLRNVDTLETGAKRLEMMPRGMTQGALGMLAPGIKQVKGDDPLEIHSDAPPPPPAPPPNSFLEGDTR